MTLRLSLFPRDNRNFLDLSLLYTNYTLNDFLVVF